MALNFAGMGFEFGATDTGAEKIATGVTKSIGSLWGSLQKIGPAVGTAGRKMNAGFGRIKGIGSRAFGGIALAATAAIEQATSPTLTSAYTSTFTEFGKSFSRMTAGMGMTNKEAKKMQRIVGGAAFGMGEDMDGAAKSVLAFEQQNVNLTKVLGSKGLKGAVRDLIKVTSVYEVEGEQLSDIAGGLIKGFGFTEERVGALADKMVYVGTKFKMGRQAIQAWPAIFESLNQELADFGRHAKPEDIENLTTSIVALGGGLNKSLGVGAAASLEIARNVFTTIMGERKNIHKMFIGMGDGLGPFAQQLHETGGDVGEMFELIKADPLHFMTMLRKMGKRAEASGGTMGVAFQRLSASVNQSLGPNVTYAMKGGWDKVQESMAKVPEYLNSPEAKGAFVKTARAHWKTSLTVQDKWERALENLKDRLLKFSGEERKKWTDDMIKGFGKTGDAIGKLSEGDGPVAKLTKKLLLLSQVGPSALFPALGKLSGVLGGMASSMFPAMTALGSMGMSFSSLGSMALAGGSLFALFNILKVGPEEALKSLETFGSDAVKKLIKIGVISEGTAAKLGDLWKTFKTEGLAAGFKKAFKLIGEMEIVGKIKKAFKDAWNFIKTVDWSGIFSDVWGGIEDAFSAIGDWIAEIDFNAIADKIGNAIGSIPWSRILSKAIDIGKDLAGWIGKILSKINWADVGELLMQGAAGLIDIASELIVNLFSPTDEGAEKAKAGLGTILVNIVGGALGIAKDLIVGMGRGFWGWIFDSESIGESLGKITKMVGVAFGALLILSKKFRGAVAKGFKTTFTKVRNEFAITQSKGQACFRIVGRGVKGMARGIRTGLKAIGGIGLFMGIIEGLQQAKTRAVNIANIMSDDLVSEMDKAGLAGEEAFMGIAETLDTALMGLPSSLGNALGISKQDLIGFYHDMVKNAELAIGDVVKLFEGGWLRIREGMAFMGRFMTATKSQMAKMWDYFTAPVEERRKIAKELEYSMGRGFMHYLKTGQKEPKKIYTKRTKEGKTRVLTDKEKKQDLVRLKKLLEESPKSIDKPSFAGIDLSKPPEIGPISVQLTSKKRKAIEEQIKDLEKNLQVGKEEKELLNLREEKSAMDKKWTLMEIGAAKGAESRKKASVEHKKRMAKAKALTEGKEDKEDKEEEKKKKKKRKTKIPVPEERAAARAGLGAPGYDTRVEGMVRQITSLSSSLTEWHKKPFDINMEIKGDKLNKFLKIVDKSQSAGMVGVK